MIFTSHIYYNNLRYIKTNNNSQYSVTKKNNAKPKPKSKPKPKPKPKPKSNPKAKPKAKPKANPKAKPKAKPNANPKANPSTTLIDSKELFNAIDVNTSEINNNVIPKYVFQTWKHSSLSKDMKDILIQLRNEHKDYKFFLYDDVMCREFIAKHFDPNILYAFDRLIPGAYKADLWRYCVLYIYGGVYMDIKLQCVDGFNLNNLIDENCFPKDIGKGIWQGFLICKPKNEILKKCIDMIYWNVKKRFYGTSRLAVTGPKLVYNALIRYKKINLYNNSKVKLVRKKRLYLMYNNKPILQFYNGYGRDKKTLGSHYSTLWGKRLIYK